MRYSLIFVLLAASAFSATVTPVCPNYGTAGVTFGGSGIDGTACFTTVFAPNGDSILLALSATPRFSGTSSGGPVVDNNLGTYYSSAGAGDPGLAQWNFNFHSSVIGTNSYVVTLRYDLDPALSTDLSALGTISGIVGMSTPLSQTQNSLNIGFPFLGVTSGAVVAPSPLPVVNVNAIGEYSFLLSVSQIPANGGAELASVGILVNTVPEPGTYALFGAGLGLMAWMRSKRRA